MAPQHGTCLTVSDSFIMYQAEHQAALCNKIHSLQPHAAVDTARRLMQQFTHPATSCSSLHSQQPHASRQQSTLRMYCSGVRPNSLPAMVKETSGSCDSLSQSTTAWLVPKKDSASHRPASLSSICVSVSLLANATCTHTQCKLTITCDLIYTNSGPRSPAPTVYCLLL